MRPTKKYCPSCHHRFLVDPSISPSTCPICGVEIKVNPTLRDTERTRGGFTIELLNEASFQDKLLAFIYEHPSSCAGDASIHFRKACNTIHAHARTLESEGFLVVDRSRRIHRYSCSVLYVPPTKLTEQLEQKTCVFCGKRTNVLIKGKCEACVAQQKLIYERFRELNRAAEASINERQRCKNAVEA